MAISAEFWSAVAATLAAASSFMIWRTQRRAFLESVRPELILTGFDRMNSGTGGSAHEVIQVRAIRNVGRGAAFRVSIRSSVFFGKLPIAIMTSKRLPILSPGEAEEFAGEVVLWFRNAPGGEDVVKAIPFSIEITCFDARENRHEVRYRLLTGP